MAKTQNTKRKKFTEKGVFIHPNISNPDSRYGNYKVNFLFRSEEDYKDTLLPVRELAKAFGETGKPTWKATKRKTGDLRLFIGDVATSFYKDTEGDITLQPKSKFAVPVYDIKGNPYPEDSIPNIGSGTTGRIKVTFEYRDSGDGEPKIAAYLQACVLIGLKSYGGFDSFEDELEEGEALPPVAAGVDTSAPVNRDNSDSAVLEADADEADADVTEGDDWV